jgi:hypothetical protein
MMKIQLFTISMAKYMFIIYCLTNIAGYIVLFLYFLFIFFVYVNYIIIICAGFFLVAFYNHILAYFPAQCKHHGLPSSLAFN